MIGLSDITAAPRVLSLGGAAQRLAPLTLRDLGELAQRVVADGPRAPAPRAASAAAGRAEPRLVAVAEFDAWLATPDGTAYALWLSLRKSQPGLPIEDARALLASPEAVRAVRASLDFLLGLPPRAWDVVAGAIPPAAPGAGQSWPRVFRDLGRRFGWTPNQIAELTLAQIAAYVVADPPDGEVATMRPAAARQYAARKRAQRAAAAANGPREAAHVA